MNAVRIHLLRLSLSIKRDSNSVEIDDLYFRSRDLLPGLEDPEAHYTGQ